GEEVGAEVEPDRPAVVPAAASPAAAGVVPAPARPAAPAPRTVPAPRSVRARRTAPRRAGTEEAVPDRRAGRRRVRPRGGPAVVVVAGEVGRAAGRESGEG